MSQEYAMGWRRAALWANRDDLIADIESPAYERDMAADLATLRQQAARVDEDAVERAARAIFESWKFDAPVAWVDGGNSLRQDTARDFARAALSAQPAPERQGEDFEEWFTRQDSRIEWPEMVRLAYHAHPAAPVGVPDDAYAQNVIAAARRVDKEAFTNGTSNISLDAMQGLSRALAAAPSAPQGTQWEGPTPESMAEILWTNRGGIPTNPGRK